MVGTTAMDRDNFADKDFYHFIELFSSDKGIQAVDSPVKLQILAMLHSKEMAFEDIVAHTGKAKSTVSVHLRDLSEAGLIRSRLDPQDARKKLFLLDSTFLGGAHSGGGGQFNIDQYIPRYKPGDGNIADFYRLIISTIRMSLISEGISIEPVLRNAGERVGKSIYHAVADQDCGVLIGNLQDFWEKYSLGHLEPAGTDPLTLMIYDCFECVDLPALGRPACAFDSGMLGAIFSGYFGERHIAVETGCYAMGDSFCRFEVRNPDENADDQFRKILHHYLR
jgi:predicted hydrocarbon binding protein